MLKKRITALLMGTVLVGTLAVGCSSGDGTGKTAKVTVSGSTSIGPTMEVLGEKFQEVNGGVAVEIQQVGSSAGVRNTIDATSEIGMSSRDLKAEEKSAGLTETVIAIDGIAVIVNKNNETKDLTLDQIKDIYTGKITNWKEVGGKDAPIVVVSREDGSGTRDGFQENVGFESEELTKEAQISDGSGNIKSTVEGNENAIGYISHGYVDETVYAIKVNGVEPVEATIKDKSYVIQRPFIIVHKEDQISENGKKLIDFILSDEGQEIVASKGFVKIK